VQKVAEGCVQCAAVGDGKGIKQWIWKVVFCQSFKLRCEARKEGMKEGRKEKEKK
jgi:hypothetical protein